MRSPAQLRAIFAALQGKSPLGRAKVLRGKGMLKLRKISGWSGKHLTFTKKPGSAKNLGYLNQQNSALGLKYFVGHRGKAPAGGAFRNVRRARRALGPGAKYDKSF